MFTSILVAFDGSAHARAALLQAADIARTQGASLTVISAWSAELPWPAGVGPPISQVAYDEYSSAVRSAAEQALTEAASLLPAGLTARTVAVEGRAAGVILDEVRAGRHDLIVMGSRGHGDAASILIGSVSHEVLHAAGVPTLIVHVASDAPPRS